VIESDGYLLLSCGKRGGNEAAKVLGNSRESRSFLVRRFVDAVW
jgi:hypothetical protein